MHINRSALSQQHRVQHYAAANDAFDFFNMLTSPELLDTLEASLPAHRERLFPPTETLSMFLAQAMKPDRSCQDAGDDDDMPKYNPEKRAEGFIQAPLAGGVGYTQSLLSKTA